MQVQDFAGGGYRTICLAKDGKGKKSLYGFGSGYYGELGNNDVALVIICRLTLLGC